MPATSGDAWLQPQWWCPLVFAFQGSTSTTRTCLRFTYVDGFYKQGGEPEDWTGPFSRHISPSWLEINNWANSLCPPAHYPPALWRCEGPQSSCQAWLPPPPLTTQPSFIFNGLSRDRTSSLSNLPAFSTLSSRRTARQQHVCSQRGAFQRILNDSPTNFRSLGQNYQRVCMEADWSSQHQCPQKFRGKVCRWNSN